MIRRAPHERNYAQIANPALRDSRLTFKARGILALLLSMPDDWAVTERWLESQSPASRAGVASGLKELEQYGYLRRYRARDDRGRWRPDAVVYENPDQPDIA